jgi:hypothetical protein
MAVKTKSRTETSARKVVVAQSFKAEGLILRTGEIIPRRGPNMRYLLDAGYVTALESEDAEFIAICHCGREFADESAMECHEKWDHEGQPAPAAAEPTGEPEEKTMPGLEPGEGPGDRDKVGLHRRGKRLA